MAQTVTIAVTYKTAHEADTRGAVDTRLADILDGFLGFEDVASVVASCDGRVMSAHAGPDPNPKPSIVWG